jgi:predicted nucleic acid-binding protein
VLYLDSSALIKHYQKEDGSEALERRLQSERENSRIVFTSVLSYAEIHAIFGRRRRERFLTTREAEALHDRFTEDWVFEMSPIELAAGVLGFVEGIAKAHPLRGTDVIHLASALWLRDAARLGAGLSKYDREVEFSSSDRQLCVAARKFGREIFNPLRSK